MVDNTHLSATTPAHAAGLVNVTVADKTSTTATLTGGYTYTKATITVTVSGTRVLRGSAELLLHPEPLDPRGRRDAVGLHHRLDGLELGRLGLPRAVRHVARVSRTDSDHQISYADGGFTVTKATITVTVSGTRVFGGAPSFSFTQNPSTPRGRRDAVRAAPPTRRPSSSVGSGYHVLFGTCTGLSTDSDHQISYADGGFTVTKATLNVKRGRQLQGLRG